MRLTKIISGGQTGADQGGLAGAKELGIATGGTAPKGYRTEAGNNPSLRDLYYLEESRYWPYTYRTRDNVRNSNGTLWVGNIGSPGYWCTKRACDDKKKPWIENPTGLDLWEWVQHYQIYTLNVAGNRESKNPGIFEKTKALIIEAFK